MSTEKSVGRQVGITILVSTAALMLTACSDGPSLPRPNMNLADMRAPRFQAPNLSVTETRQHGYQFSQQQLEQVPIGASKDQVDFVLGTPSTTGTFDGEVYYYISQQVKQTAFFRPRVTDQQVLAVYFDKDDRVTRIANYGLQDGRVFDFIGRKTATAGKELTFLEQVLRASRMGNPLGSGQAGT